MKSQRILLVIGWAAYAGRLAHAERYETWWGVHEYHDPVYTDTGARRALYRPIDRGTQP